MACPRPVPIAVFSSVVASARAAITGCNADSSEIKTSRTLRLSSALLSGLPRGSEKIARGLKWMREAAVLALCSVKSEPNACAWSAGHRQPWAKASPMIRFKNLIEVPPQLLNSTIANRDPRRATIYASAAPKLRRFVVINHVVIKMLDASISIDADLMEGERLCTLMGRCDPGDRRSSPTPGSQCPKRRDGQRCELGVQERNARPSVILPTLIRSPSVMAWYEDSPTRTFRKLSRASVLLGSNVAPALLL